MMGVARRAITEQLAKDRRTASHGVVPPLQDEIGSPLAQRDSLALSVERGTRLGVDRLQDVEPAVGQPAKGIAAAGQGNIRVT